MRFGSTEARKQVFTCVHCGGDIRLTSWNGELVRRDGTLLYEHIPHVPPYPNTLCRRLLPDETKHAVPDYSVLRLNLDDRRLLFDMKIGA